MRNSWTAFHQIVERSFSEDSDRIEGGREAVYRVRTLFRKPAKKIPLGQDRGRESSTKAENNLLGRSPVTETEEDSLGLVEHSLQPNVCVMGGFLH